MPRMTSKMAPGRPKRPRTPSVTKFVGIFNLILFPITPSIANDKNEIPNSSAILNAFLKEPKK